MTLSWPLSRQQVLDLNGRPMLDARARFFEAGTTTPLTVFSDAGRTQPRAQPVAPDAAGRFPRVFLPDGQYAEQVFSASAGELWYDGALGTPVVTPDPTDPEAPTDASSYFRTGDVKWRLDGAILPGWVRMNARTIGSAASGSSERSNADTQALYTYLWQTFSDGIAPVVGGRGGGAVNDFSAGKQIVIPTMQGLVAAGVDTMGSTAAGRLQTIVQVALTAGSNVVEVSDRSRISIGMLLLSEGVSAGTVVTSIDGNKVRLNQAVASTGSFVGRFSLLADAQTYGCLGGDALFLIEKANLPVEMPGSSIRVEYPSQKGVKYTSLASVQAGNLQNVTNLWQLTEDYLTTPPDPKDYAVTIRNEGGGVPHPTLQPMRLGTFYLKL